MAEKKGTRLSCQNGSLKQKRLLNLLCTRLLNVAQFVVEDLFSSLTKFVSIVTYSLGQNMRFIWISHAPMKCSSKLASWIVCKPLFHLHELGREQLMYEQAAPCNWICKHSRIASLVSHGRSYLCKNFFCTAEFWEAVRKKNGNDFFVIAWVSQWASLDSPLSINGNVTYPERSPNFGFVRTFAGHQGYLARQSKVKMEVSRSFPFLVHLSVFLYMHKLLINNSVSSKYAVHITSKSHVQKHTSLYLRGCPEHSSR